MYKNAFFILISNNYLIWVWITDENPNTCKEKNIQLHPCSNYDKDNTSY